MGVVHRPCPGALVLRRRQEMLQLLHYEARGIQHVEALPSNPYLKLVKHTKTFKA